MEFHILSLTPNGKGTRTLKMAKKKKKKKKKWKIKTVWAESQEDSYFPEDGQKYKSETLFNITRTRQKYCWKLRHCEHNTYSAHTCTKLHIGNCLNTYSAHTCTKLHIGNCLCHYILQQYACETSGRIDIVYVYHVFGAYHLTGMQVGIFIGDPCNRNIYPCQWKTNHMYHTCMSMPVGNWNINKVAMAENETWRIYTIGIKLSIFIQHV